MRPMLLPLISLFLHAWIAWRLVPDLGAPWSVLLLAIIALSALTAPLGLGLRRAAGRGRFVHVASRIGLVAIGLFSSLLVLTLLRDLGLLLLSLVDRVEPAWLGVGNLRAVEVASARAVAGLALFATAWGFFNARRTAAVRRVDVPIAALPAGLHGFTIAQLSDMHVGPTIRRPFVERVVAAVNALDADVVAITGDLVDGSRARARAARRSAGGPAFARRHLLRHRQPRVLLGRRRLGGRVASARTHGARQPACGDPARRGDAGAGRRERLQRRPLRPRRRQRPRAGARRQPAGRGAPAARAPAAQRRGGRGGRLRPAALRSHPRRPVPALEFPGPAAAALHRRPASAGAGCGSTPAAAPATGARRSASARLRKSPCSGWCRRAPGCRRRAAPCPGRPLPPLGSEGRAPPSTIHRFCRPAPVSAKDLIPCSYPKLLPRRRRPPAPTRCSAVSAACCR